MIGLFLIVIVLSVYGWTMVELRAADEEADLTTDQPAPPVTDDVIFESVVQMPTSAQREQGHYVYVSTSYNEAVDKHLAAYALLRGDWKKSWYVHRWEDKIVLPDDFVVIDRVTKAVAQAKPTTASSYRSQVTTKPRRATSSLAKPVH